MFRREAEELNNLIESGRVGDAIGVTAPELTDLAAFAGTISSAVSVDASEEAVDSSWRALAARLDARPAARVLAPADAHFLAGFFSSGWVPRLVTAAAALVLITGGVASAASGSLPGSSLYPVKKAIERVVGAATLSNLSRAQGFLDRAENRVGEGFRLLALGRAGDLGAITTDARSDMTDARIIIKGLGGVRSSELAARAGVIEDRLSFLEGVGETLERSDDGGTGRGDHGTGVSPEDETPDTHGTEPGDDRGGGGTSGDSGTGDGGSGGGEDPGGVEPPADSGSGDDGGSSGSGSGSIDESHSGDGSGGSTTTTTEPASDDSPKGDDGHS